MIRLAILAATALSLAGCASGPAPGPAVAQAVPVYRLAADDRVKINVYGEEELSGEYLVGSDGRISLPLVGMVEAGGLTLAELQAALTRRLGARYLKNPKVSADIVAYRPFYILGEVSRAGQYPYRVGITVNAAVATAGGFTYRANQKTVAIQRHGSGGEQKHRLTPDLLVQPGDTIRILERFF